MAHELQQKKSIKAVEEGKRSTKVNSKKNCYGLGAHQSQGSCVHCGIKYYITPGCGSASRPQAMDKLTVRVPGIPLFQQKTAAFAVLYSVPICWRKQKQNRRCLTGPLPPIPPDRYQSKAQQSTRSMAFFPSQVKPFPVGPF